MAEQLARCYHRNYSPIAIERLPDRYVHITVRTQSGVSDGLGSRNHVSVWPWVRPFYFLQLVGLVSLSDAWDDPYGPILRLADNKEQLSVPC